MVGHSPGTNEFNFGDDPDHYPDPGIRSSKSGFTGLSKKLPTDFDEFLWRAGVWPSYILVTIRITLRIRESVPDHDPDPGRAASLSIMLAFSRGLCSLTTSSFFLKISNCPMQQHDMPCGQVATPSEW